MDPKPQVDKQSSNAVLGGCALMVVGLLAIGFMVEGSKTESPEFKNLAEDEKLNRVVTKIIALNGYECPRAQHIWSQGDSPYGWKLEALCGPADGDGSNPALHYIVYPKKMMAVTCKPFGPLGGGCD